MEKQNYVIIGSYNTPIFFFPPGRSSVFEFSIPDASAFPVLVQRSSAAQRLGGAVNRYIIGKKKK